MEARVEDVVPGNIDALLEGMDVILDGTDNFETRYLINDYAVKNFRAVDLCGRGGQLRGDVECVAGKDGVPGMHFSGHAAGNGRDLRNLRDIEYGGERGCLDCGD